MHIKDMTAFLVLRDLFVVTDGYTASEGGTVTVRAGDGKLRLRTSSSGCCLEAVLQGDADETLAKPLTVARKALTAVALRGSSATISQKKGQLLVSSGSSRYRLPVQATKRQGRFPDLSNTKPVVINAAILKAALQSTHFGHDETGTKDVRISIRKGTLTVDTADAFRAAVYQERMPEVENEIETVLQHASLLKTVSAFETDDLWIRANDRSCSLSNTSTAIWLPVVGARQYHTLTQLAKARERYRTQAKVVVSTTDIRDAIKDAVAVLESKSRVPVEFQVRDSKLYITTHGELGTHEARMGVESVVGHVSFATFPSYVRVMATLAAKAGDRCEIEVLGDRVVLFSVRGQSVRTLYLFSQRQQG